MSERIRILMTADTIGGIWNYAVELCQALDVHADILVAAMGGPAKPHQRAVIERVGVHFEEADFRLEWMEDPWDDIQRSGAWLLELESAFQPDIIHLNTFTHGDLPWSAPVLMVGHSCVWSWWDAVHGSPPPNEWNRYRQCVRSGLHAANTVIAPTRAMLDCLDQWYGPLPNATVIHNGTTPTLSDCRTKAPLILAAGRLWDKAKNISTLASAARRIPWPVVVAGDGAGSTSDEFSGVRLLGSLPSHALYPWMESAAVYALPARYEPFGLSILEAAQRRCALILGDIPSLRELWDGAAHFVPPNDVRALELAIRRLMQDHLLRESSANEALARSKHFTPQRMARKYLDAYRELLGIRAPQMAGKEAV